MFTHKIKLLLITTFVAFTAFVNAETMQDIRFAELPGERAEIRLSFDSVPPDPDGYAIEQPARIVLDFVGVQNGLPEKKYSMAVGEVSSAVVLAAGGRTRLIINLENPVPYTSRIEGNDYIVEIGSESASGSSVARSTPTASESGSDFGQSEFVPKTDSAAISGIDFRRGEAGEGKVILSLTDPGVNVDVEEVSGGIEVRFLNTELPEALRRKLDVLDFATPVSTLTARKEGDGATISVAASGSYDYLAYQADNQYVVSVKPLTRQELEEEARKFAYVGEKMSLNFQDIQVRNILQLIADFTDLNLVASDTVTGSITLRLENVPWDQALDIVLKTKGLDKRQVGNVLMVAPAAEIAERERQEIETQKQLMELAPLRTEYIRIRYANARELFNLFMDSGRGEGGGAGNNERNATGSILSERGQAIVDERTNSIILTDTEEKINEFKTLIDRIDIPVQQVMIEARIVIADSNFNRELGVRINAAGARFEEDRSYGTTGRLEGAFSEEGPVQGLFSGTVDEFVLNDTTAVNLGVNDPAGALTFNVLDPNFLLGLELSALEEMGFAEIVSQPKVITGDKQQATIESGTEIPYQEESASGGTTTTFKEAVLKLDVTPQITPDNRIIMDLVINQDSISSIDQASGIPILDITQLETQVLVADGETIVLGGIYQTEVVTGERKVPLLGDIPIIGRLFRNDVRSEDKKELLVFITPRIMASNLAQ